MVGVEKDCDDGPRQKQQEQKFSDHAKATLTSGDEKPQPEAG